MVALITRLFPLWALLVTALAYAFPGGFVPLKDAIVPLLGVVMFGMGMTLTAASFREVLRRPWVVAIGVGLQFLLMPAIAWALTTGLALPTAVGAGLILVGSCPGGTASNVICYLARGDVALSITLTTVSTLASVVATPLLTWAYVGAEVPVPVIPMLLDVLKIVIVPVLLGVLVNTWLHRRLRAIEHGFPAVSVVAIVLIIGVIVALNRDRFADLAGIVVVAVMLHNLLGLAGGYGLARLLGLDERTCRTVSIEVGMQNSGLGVALAVQHFTPVAALPGAVFSVWHNLSGSLLAGYWRVRRP
jgi:BASS family bile acid:Na+ symporter